MVGDKVVGAGGEVAGVAVVDVEGSGMLGAGVVGSKV